MKKILLLFVAMICAAAGWAQEATVSATVTNDVLEVSLQNGGTAFVAFQIDITLPEGVNVAENGAVEMVETRLDQPGTASVFDPNETVDFKIAYKQNGNVLRVLAYNLANRKIAGTDGAIFSVKLSEATEETVKLSNIKFVTESQLEEMDLADVDAVTEEGFHPYDVNKDGDVDGYDALAILTAIMNFDTDLKYDLNDDTEVDGYDAIVILAYIQNNF